MSVEKQTGDLVEYKKFVVKNEMLKQFEKKEEPLQDKRMLIIVSCKVCPCRLHKDDLPVCGITGDIIRSTNAVFPEHCILDTVREFYACLKRIADESN